MMLAHRRKSLACLTTILALMLLVPGFVSNASANASQFIIANEPTFQMPGTTSGQEQAEPSTQNGAGNAPAAINNPNGAVYYVSDSTGNDANDGLSPSTPFGSLAQAASSATAGDNVYIMAGTYHEQLRPQRNGTAGKWITYAAYPGHEVTLDGRGTSVGGEWQGMIHVKNRQFIVIEGINMANSDGVGVMIDASSNITLKGCSTTNTWSSGIGVWDCNQITVENNMVHRANTGGPNECLTVANTQNFTIANNFVSEPGPGNTWAGEGIDIKQGSRNGRVVSNSVYGITDNIAIYIDSWGPTRDIEVSGNNVQNCLIGVAISSEKGQLVENIYVTNNQLIDSIHFGVIVNTWAQNGPRNNIHITNNVIDSSGVSGWHKGIEVEDGANVTNLIIENNQITL